VQIYVIHVVIGQLVSCGVSVSVMNSLDKVILHIMYVPNFENIINTKTHEYRLLDYTMDMLF